MIGIIYRIIEGRAKQKKHENRLLAIVLTIFLYIFVKTNHLIIIAILNLIQVLSTRQPDMFCKMINGHIRPSDYTQDSLPISIQICLIHFFSPSLQRGLVVQWIEYKIPVLTMKVRILSRSHVGLMRPIFCYIM